MSQLSTKHRDKFGKSWGKLTLNLLKIEWRVWGGEGAVSYTHLTLPTIYSV